MEGVSTYNQALAKGMFNPLSTLTSRAAYSIEMVVMLLYMMSGLNLLDIYVGVPGGVIQIGINMFLAYNLKSLRSWARTATLVRVMVGIVANFFILGLHNADISGFPALTLVFALYGIFPLIISAVLMQSGARQAYKTERR